MDKTRIYKVTTEGDVEGRSTKTLGYCTGEVDDIKAFYDNEKYYQLYIEPIEVKVITGDSALKKHDLVKRKKQLEAELKRIEGQL